MAHIYLITTGHSVTSHLKAMLTGFEELEDEDITDEEMDLIKIKEEKDSTTK